MSQASSIEWTDATWNPVRGCTKVSPGCKHCYAETFAERWRGVKGHPYEQGFDLRLVPEKLAEPLYWRRPRRVFVNSMSDLFHEDVPNEYIAAVFGVMGAARRHTFQLLTKRARRMREWFEWYEGTSGAGASPLAAYHAAVEATRGPVTLGQAWPLPNVWLGVSAEDQGRADERIYDLLACPAAVRFVSAEPLLGPMLQLKPWIERCRCGAVETDFGACGECPARGVDWVIVGGESGPGARPFDIAWGRDIVRQCREAGVACFVKQLGAKPTDSAFPDYAGPGRFIDRKGGDPGEWPPELRVREWPAERGLS